jgi:hypothetical protein
MRNIQQTSVHNRLQYRQYTLSGHKHEGGNKHACFIKVALSKTFWDELMTSLLKMRQSLSLWWGLEIKTAVLRDAAPCSLVDTDRRLTGTYCLHHKVDDRSIQTKIQFSRQPTVQTSNTELIETYEVDLYTKQGANWNTFYAYSHIVVS